MIRPLLTRCQTQNPHALDLSRKCRKDVAQAFKPGCLKPEKEALMTSESKTMPSVFVGVGGPRQIWDDEWNGKLHGWAESMPRPEAILMFSAHWTRFPITLGAREPVPLTYDYYNFPKHFYDVRSPAPPAPTLADRFVEVMGDKLEIYGSNRGLDHGAFIGLMGMYPEYDVPVLQVSIPTFEPEMLFEIGR